MDPQKDDSTLGLTNNVMDVQPPKKTEQSTVNQGTTVTISPDGEPTFIAPTPGTSIQPQPAEGTTVDREELPSTDGQRSNGIATPATDNSGMPELSQLKEEFQVTEESVVREESTPTLIESKETSLPLETERVEEPQTEAKTETQQSQTNPMAIPPKPKKSGLSKLVILIAILIALLLAGVSVYAYMEMQGSRKKQETKTTTPTEQTEQKTEEVSKLTSEDVDAVITDVDKQINSTDDTKDIPSADSVNDQTLGL